jgi:hypothetical protein
MATVVFIHRLQPADGKRDALIGLLREFATWAVTPRRSPSCSTWPPRMPSASTCSSR